MTPTKDQYRAAILDNLKRLTQAVETAVTLEDLEFFDNLIDWEEFKKSQKDNVLSFERRNLQ